MSSDSQDESDASPPPPPPPPVPETPGGAQSSAYDVVLVHGETPDGEGARVLRARPGRLEAGEVRPLRSGCTLSPGGEVVRLVPRQGAPVYDVKVEYEVPSSPARSGGPAQVATPAYRDSWERTFGSKALN